MDRLCSLSMAVLHRLISNVSGSSLNPNGAAADVQTDWHGRERTSVSSNFGRFQPRKKKGKCFRPKNDRRFLTYFIGKPPQLCGYIRVGNMSNAADKYYTRMARFLYRYKPVVYSLPSLAKCYFAAAVLHVPLRR